MKRAIVLLVLAAGCIPMAMDDPTITADIAVDAACALAKSSDKKPDDDSPKPGDPCPNCDGRGFVGDGTVRVPCQPCNGGGKVIASVMVVECPDGQCILEGL